MSFKLRELADKSPKLTRAKLLAARSKKDYSDGRTQNAFKDETDINRIMQRYATTQTISHLAKNEAFYGDFSDFDFTTSAAQLARGRQIFNSAPSEIRKEFDEDPAKFFEFVNDPDNIGRLDELLPALAKPGRQLPDLSGKTAPAVASEPEANVTNTTQVDPALPPDPAAQGE